MPLISNDIENDDRVNKEACRKIDLNSMIVIPLICKDDVVGILKVLSAKVGHFNDSSIAILEIMSGLIAAAMFNAISNGDSELLHKATHDHLTGISNRALFYDRLRQINLRASIGYALFNEDGLELEELIDKADKSMYEIKRARKGAENVR